AAQGDRVPDFPSMVAHEQLADHRAGTLMYEPVDDRWLKTIVRVDCQGSVRVDGEGLNDLVLVLIRRAQVCHRHARNHAGQLLDLRAIARGQTEVTAISIV